MWLSNTKKRNGRYYKKLIMKTTELAIGMLRQWLNEERITDSKKMVTNAEIELCLGIIGKREFKKRIKIERKHKIKLANAILIPFIKKEKHRLLKNWIISDNNSTFNK